MAKENIAKPTTVLANEAAHPTFEIEEQKTRRTLFERRRRIALGMHGVVPADNLEHDEELDPRHSRLPGDNRLPSKQLEETKDSAVGPLVPPT